MTRWGRISTLLSKVPPDVDLEDASDESLIAANKVWDEIDSLAPSELGDAKLSKLLARKRPRLVPITDEVVKRYLGERDLWSSLRAALSDSKLRQAIQELDCGAGASPLRTLDAAIWLMRSASKQAEAARKDAGMLNGGPISIDP